MTYRCAILNTSGSPEAAAHNDQWLGPKTLGIEVTRDILAKRCGLGNIDPQHVEGGKSSAAEAALEWPLPPDDTCLVSIRNDKDMAVAMAVFALRIEGHEHLIDKMLVHWIGVLDRMTYQMACETNPDLAAMFDRTPTDAMNYIIKGGDKRYQTLVAKVRAVALILCGKMPHYEMQKLADLRAAARRNSKADFWDQLEKCGSEVAYIEAPGEYEEARNWGNRRFPVTVVYDDRRETESGGTQQRWTLVRQEGCFDRRGFEDAICAAEAQKRGLTLSELSEQSMRWGGNKNIVSSPQGAGYGTKLSKEEILAIAQACAESGIVS